MNNNPTKEEIDFIYQSLIAFNEAKVGPDNHILLNIVEYDDNGNIIGGLLGGTYWGWMHVDILWVAEEHRHRGLGRKLLMAAEEEARARGCRHVHLDTMSWQVPDFYPKMGYRLVGILPDFPTGNRKFLYTKDL